MDEATLNGYVLIVDDDALLREAVSEVLEEEDYACLNAARVDDGLDLIRANPELDIVLVDLAMPGKSGIDMITLAHEQACDIVINGDGRSGSERHFDPAVLKVFARDTDHFAEIFERDSE